MRRLLVSVEDKFAEIFQFTLVRFACYFALISTAFVLISWRVVPSKYHMFIATSAGLLIFVTENINRIYNERLQVELLQTKSMI